MTDQMLDKIRKLLAQAEDAACTEAEAAAFTAKAARLIADHGIDEALLAQDDASRGGISSRTISMHAPYAREKGTLLSVIATQLRCSAVLHQIPSYDDQWRRTNLFSVECFGHEADLALTEMLFTSLLVQAGRDLLRARPPRGERVSAFRRSWWMGFASAINQRLEEAEQQAARAAESRFAAAGTSTAVVLADRMEAAELARREAYPHLRSVKRTLSGSGGRDGWAAGLRADLGRHATVSSTPRGEVAG